MELLAFGDPHIKPTGATIDYDALEIPSNVDVVVTTGDVVHRTGQEDLRAGRTFFERLDAADVPIVGVPGNHDPLDQYDSLVGGLENVVVAHERVVTGDAFTDVHRDALSGRSIVGWGCERFDCKPEIRFTSFEALDPRDAANRRYAAAEAASRLEDAVFDYVTGDADRTELERRLGVREGERRAFREQLSHAESRFDRLDSLLAAAPAPTVFLSHVPPYNTPLDRHHSIGERELDLDGLHVGSLSLKLALRLHSPVVALSGHSHNGAYQAGIDGKGGVPHLLNLDFRGIVRIRVGSDGAFGFEFL